MLSALEEGGVLLIDELDVNLHPLMTREIVRLFNSRETNPNGAQLIFTTQDTNLLDNELFRRDQIWFVEKNRYGASQLYSLAEFKGVRNDLSFERGYIEGRFGAIPYLNPNKLRALLVEGDGEEA
jgi:AAA15 family ATPase/GTPase